MFSTLKRRYHAYTLLELLIVLSIFSIIGGMTFASFDGLQNTIKMNEYMLNLEQDVRTIQRESMLLERTPGEDWLYGLGIDFTKTTTTGVYKVFKWCSPFPDYGDTKTKSKLPAYDPAVNLGIGRNGYLPTDRTIGTSSSCNGEGLATFPGYDTSIDFPESEITIDNGIGYVVFESISGRAFFYDANGELVNYQADGKQAENVFNFVLTIDPLGVGKTRQFIVNNLSGKISSLVL